MITAAALLPAVPLLAALVGLMLCTGERPARWPAAALGIGGASAALVLATVLAAGTWGRTSWLTAGWRVADLGGLPVTASVRVDSAAALVAVAVGVVALAVQVYSVAYLAGDAAYPPYAAQVSLFTAAMLLVVVAGDLIALLIGWEVMGICSYLLIGHDRRLPEAPRAAVKAFLVTRVGDVGFLLGVAVLGTGAGSFRIADVLAAAGPGGAGAAGAGPHYSATRITVATLLLLAGVAGKSAQFPLHTWLPDAMAGPTPISALIHAATMVAAGVYLVIRLYPLFLAAPATLATLGVLASVTMLLGALAATAQDDIKRVLAWSTVSQIGYMTGALAVGASAAAEFHLLTHAAFKALLFLAAGGVIHAVGGNSLRDMGGLRRGMPVTFWATTVGLAALAGVPPLAGFWSKDSIIAAAAGARDGSGPAPGWVGWLVLLAGLVTVLVTAWYATRLWLRAFFGRYRGAGAPHEPPGAMRWPVVALAVPAALLGLAGLSEGFSRAVSGVGGTIIAPPPGRVAHLDLINLYPLAALIAGAALAGWQWRTRSAAGATDPDPAEALGALRPVLANAGYLDAVQDALVVRPVRALARAVRRADESIVDGAVRGVGAGGYQLGGLLTRLHRAPLPRAATAVLGGALLIAVLAVALAGTR